MFTKKLLRNKMTVGLQDIKNFFKKGRNVWMKETSKKEYEMID